MLFHGCSWPRLWTQAKWQSPQTGHSVAKRLFLTLHWHFFWSTLALKNGHLFLPEPFCVAHRWASDRADHQGSLRIRGSAQRERTAMKPGAAEFWKGNKQLRVSSALWPSLPHLCWDPQEPQAGHRSHEGIGKCWSPKKQFKVLGQPRGGKTFSPHEPEQSMVTFSLGREGVSFLALRSHIWVDNQPEVCFAKFCKFRKIPFSILHQ